METCSFNSLGNFRALSMTVFQILLKLLSCSTAVVHNAYRSGSMNGASSSGESSSSSSSSSSLFCLLGEALSRPLGASPSLWEVSVTLTVVKGGSSSCLYRCYRRLSCWPSGVSCSLRESASGREARVPGRYEKLKQYRANISAHRICRSFKRLAFMKCSKFLWSVRIVKGFTLRSSASHSSRQRITASNSLSWMS